MIKKIGKLNNLLKHTLNTMKSYDKYERNGEKQKLII